MELSNHVNRSAALDTWIDRRLKGIKWPSDIRSVLAAGCFDVSLEHHKAVVLLVQHRLFGSAFSLVRSVFESYVRGIWLHRCATEKELLLFQSEKLDKPVDTLISAIEKVDGFDVGVLSKVKKQWWPPMNSFIHCGFAQVARRISGAEFRPNYETVEIEEALRFVDAIVVLVVGYIAGVVGDRSLIQAVLSKQDEA